MENFETMIALISKLGLTHIYFEQITDKYTFISSLKKYSVPMSKGWETNEKAQWQHTVNMICAGWSSRKCSLPKGLSSSLWQLKTQQKGKKVTSYDSSTGFHHRSTTSMWFLVFWEENMFIFSKNSDYENTISLFVRQRQRGKMTNTNPPLTNFLL